MNIFVNDKKIGTSLLSVKKKVKKVSGINADAIIEIRYHKGNILRYKIVTKSVDTKRTKGLTRVNFKLIQ